MNLIDTDKLIADIQLSATHPGDISIITLLEILRGIDDEKRPIIKKLLEQHYRVHGIENDVVLVTCSIYNQLKQDGEIIPDADLIIAATAISKNLTLVTGDHHFQRLTKYGLKLEP